MYQFLELQDTFICQLVIDMTLDDRLRHPTADADEESSEFASEYTLQWEDPLYTTLRQVWVEKDITARIIWAAQIAFDISEACQGATAGLQVTADAAKRIRKSFGFHFDASGALDTEEIRWLAKDQSNLRNIYRCVQIHMSEPLVSD